MKRTRSHWRFVLGGLILSLVWASPIGAQEQPILRFEGRVTYPAPSEMLVALDSGGVVMLDLARMPQGEIRQIAQKSLELPAARAPGTEIRREADGSGVSQPFSTWSTTMTPSKLSGSREQRPPMLLSTSSLSRELV